MSLKHIEIYMLKLWLIITSLCNFMEIKANEIDMKIFLMQNLAILCY